MDKLAEVELAELEKKKLAEVEISTALSMQRVHVGRWDGLGGGRVGGAPKGGGAKLRGFFPSPDTSPFSLFLSLSGCLFVEFWWCLRAPGPSNVHVWNSRVVV